MIKDTQLDGTLGVWKPVETATPHKIEFEITDGTKIKIEDLCIDLKVTTYGQVFRAALMLLEATFKHDPETAENVRSIVADWNSKK